MAIRSITQLKKWFRRGMYPTESQFADWIDSFWHKEEDRIPMSTIEGLSEVINNKYPADAGKELEREVDTLTADLAAHKVENEYKFNCINEDITNLETADEEIQADLVTVHQDITGLQATDTAIQADIQALQQTDMEVKQDITDLQAADAQLTQQIGTKADANHTHTGYVTTDHTHTKAQITDFPASMPASGGNADTVGGLSSANIARGGHVSGEITGSGWFRIAKMVNSGVGLMTLVNNYNYHIPTITSFFVCAGHNWGKNGDQITQLGGADTVKKARIIKGSPDGTIFLEVYIDAGTANRWFIMCSNMMNIELINPVPGDIPTGCTVTVEEAFKANYTNLTAKAAESIAGVLTEPLRIKPSNTSGVQDGIILEDNGSGAGEGLKITWTSPDYPNNTYITGHNAGLFLNSIGKIYANEKEIATTDHTHSGMMKIITAGHVFANGSKGYDCYGTYFSVSKSGNDYTISHNLNKSTYHVILTGGGGGNGQIYAALLNKQPNTFLVRTADDSSGNEGEFYFTLYEMI